MRITPLDVKNHPFEKRLFGFDQEEVGAFLEMVATDYEAALRDSQKLREKVAELRTKVDDFAANEAILKETLTTAQRLADDLKTTAVKEAEVLLSEAEIKAEKVLDAAHRRASKLSEDIREMKMLRTQLASSVRGQFQTHLAMLDSLAGDPAGSDADPEPPRQEVAPLRKRSGLTGRSSEG